MICHTEKRNTHRLMRISVENLFNMKISVWVSRIDFESTQQAHTHAQPYSFEMNTLNSLHLSLPLSTHKGEKTITDGNKYTEHIILCTTCVVSIFMNGGKSHSEFCLYADTSTKNVVVQKCVCAIVNCV